MSKMQTRHTRSFGLIYQPNYILPEERAQILQYLQELYPIWEMRFSKNNPPPSGQTQRQLLRPVYWLGNWQFACLNYYHPPQGIQFRCVRAEKYPPVLAKIVKDIEDITRSYFAEKDIPKGWNLNTCLINYYGSKIEDGKKTDTARVGEHKDFEPGPVGSISFGERALIQFVESKGRGIPSRVMNQEWLEDSSLQIFGGDRFKKQLFHRVQRVEKKLNKPFENLNTSNFETRRINFTFRYVPEEHIQTLSKFPKLLQDDVQEYVEQLSTNSPYWKKAAEAYSKVK